MKTPGLPIPPYLFPALRNKNPKQEQDNLQKGSYSSLLSSAFMKAMLEFTIMP